MSRWERLAGDTRVFAAKIGFSDDPDPGQGAAEDVSQSWGAFQLWAGGLNLCAHQELGERIESVHWYLLPLLEWFARCWDPMFHEERLPCSNTATQAWTALKDARFAPPSADEDTELAWESDWQGWWSRHALVAARDGGIFPDVVFRRLRDSVEISWGNTPTQGTPDHVIFEASASRAITLRPAEVAEPLYAVLTAAAGYLSSTLPSSNRVREVERDLRRLSTSRTDHRMMWLAGLGVDHDSVRRGWRRLKRQLAELSKPQRAALLAAHSSSRLVVEGSCHAALMFGSYAPTIAKPDVLALAKVMIHLSRLEKEPDPLAELCHDVPVSPGAQPWTQGYDLAVELHDRIGLPDNGADFVDVEAVLAQLGVEVTETRFDDDSVRGVAIAGPRHRPGMAWNAACPFNQSLQGHRFTLAHELCHLLFDRHAGRRLAIASGPWAPFAVEQRANAFAAMLLMPTPLIVRAVSQMEEPITTANGVAGVASTLRTGFEATLWHLQNLAFIDDFQTQRIRAEGRGAAR